MFPAIVSFVLMLLAIYLLAIITDEFFIESLEEIAKLWKLPDNVAGASLMAMGSSMPELSIALIALVSEDGAHSEVGIGTIVGSAVFNILVITGASALVRPATISWKVILRDCLFYTISIFLLLGVYRDGQVVIAEALVFLALYTVYIIVLFQWNRFFPEETESEDLIEMVEKEIEAGLVDGSIYQLVTRGIGNIIRLLTGPPRKSFVRAFLVSVLLIAALSYVLVENAVVFASAIGVPPLLIALTILAGGSSVPDLIASMLVSKEGKGDMAITNAVGSNIFDIAIGLGVPWLIVLLVGGSAIPVGTEGLYESTLILLGTVVILFLFLTIGKQLSRFEGAVLLVIYVVYVVWVWMSAGGQG